ncbi:MAG: glycosyltransferase family 4 protein [Chloroflexota bacterium]
MRIFLFHYYSKKPNPVYQEMATSFRMRGHEVWLAEPDPDGRLAIKGAKGIERLIDGVASSPAGGKRLPLIGNLSSRQEMFSFLGRVKNVIRELSPNIVQVNPPNMAWYLPMGMPSSMQFVLDIRQINEAVNKTVKTQIRERLNIESMRFNGRFAYKKTCFCHEQAAIRILGDSWQKLGAVVPVGVDDQFIEFQYPNEPVTLKPARTFVYIGTLSRLRNLEKLLEAARHLCHKTDQFQLDLIGPDTSNGYYQQVIDQLGIQSVAAVKTAVPYNEVPELLSTYDVGLAYVPDRPTWHYQPTIKALEYRALGLPIISTNVASHREIIEQNKNGLLCEDTPEDIADAMYQLIGSPERYNDVKQNARDMRQGNSWLTIADMYLSKVYQPLMREVSHR